MSEEPIKIYLPTEEEEASIQAMIIEDDEDFAAEPALKLGSPAGRVVLIEDEEDPRQLIGLWVEKDVVAYFKGFGQSWQDRMNTALRHAAFGGKEGQEGESP